jgi:hypothetical protein
MCFTPFPPMRQRAVLFPVSHRPASAIMHNSTSNTNPLGSPPRKAHCRLLAIDLSHGGQRRTTTTTSTTTSTSPVPGRASVLALPTIIGELLPSSHHPQPSIPAVQACLCPSPSPSPSLQTKRRGRQAARAFSLGTTLAAHFLQLSSPQNLAIKTPSPRPQLHRKRNTFGLGPARRVHFRWMSNIRPKLPCARGGPSPTVTTKTPTVRTTAAVEKMAKGPARDSGGLCLYRKHYALPNR